MYMNPARVPEAHLAVRAPVVDVIDMMRMHRLFGLKWLIAPLVWVAVSQSVMAQVLPEDRADALYHSYDGGGLTVTGPSLLVRKKVTKDVSLTANYYVDSISSASIDVLSYASPYKEKRTEVSLGADYLLGDTILTAGFTNSDENDFKAETASFGVRQEIFGGLTVVSLGYSRGWDEIGQITDPDFSREADKRLYRMGVSQVISKRLVMNLDFEGITDQGFLNNPYRQVRYELPGGQGYGWQSEVYPATRTSSAVSLGGRYFLGEGSVVYGNARLYGDTWGIAAWNTKVGYTHIYKKKWIFDASYRYYTQTAADFYSDLFPYADAQNFMGRDKEISTFNDHSLRFDVSYDFAVDKWEFLERGTLNFSYNYILFSYDDFRNVLDGGPAGTESLYDFNAGVAQVFVSFWF
jgi:hypothetical protein